MSDYRIYENKYGKYAVTEPLAGAMISNLLKSGRVYEERTITFIRNNINNKNMIHAGTFVGDMLPAFCNATTGTVYAFEPVTEHYYCASETIKLNDLKNVVLTPIGLSNEVAYADIGFSDNGKMLYGRASFTFQDVSGKETVPVTTIDSFIDDEIGMIQLDIEGYEIMALKGAINTIRKYNPILVLENINKSDPFWINEIMPLGYECVLSAENNTFWIVP